MLSDVTIASQGAIIKAKGDLIAGIGKAIGGGLGGGKCYYNNVIIVIMYFEFCTVKITFCIVI